MRMFGMLTVLGLGMVGSAWAIGGMMVPIDEANPAGVVKAIEVKPTDKPTDKPKEKPKEKPTEEVAATEPDEKPEQVDTDKLCKDLEKHEADKAKKGNVDDKKQAPEVAPAPAKGGPKTYLASAGSGDSSQAAEGADGSAPSKAYEDINNMTDEQRAKLKKACDEVKIDNITINEGGGTEGYAPAFADVPTATPGYVDYSGGVTPNSPLGNTQAGGIETMLEYMVQQQMQQEGQSGCPAGTTLTLVSGQPACVGTTNTRPSATCVTLSNKTYCRENNCGEDGREVIRINGVNYCTTPVGGNTSGTVVVTGTIVVTGTGVVTGTAVVTGTGVVSGTRSVDDVAVRMHCKTDMEILAKQLDVPTCLMEMAFRRQADLGGPNACVEGEGTTEADVFNFNPERKRRLLLAKDEFDAGKADAVNGKAVRQNTIQDPFRIGYSCGGSLLKETK
ncbi:MAG: hypothetical protein ACK5YK_00420 [Pseudomonadota bacterium]